VRGGKETKEKKENTDLFAGIVQNILAITMFIIPL